MGCCTIGGEVEFARRPTAGAAGSCANIGVGDAAARILVVECTLVCTGVVGAAVCSKPLRNNALGADRNTLAGDKCGTLLNEPDTGLGSVGAPVCSKPLRNNAPGADRNTVAGDGQMWHPAQRTEHRTGPWSADLQPALGIHAQQSQQKRT